MRLKPTSSGITCPSCGAKLSPPPGAAHHTCPYCNATVDIAAQTASMQRPPAGTPGFNPKVLLGCIAGVGAVVVLGVIAVLFFTVREVDTSTMPPGARASGPSAVAPAKGSYPLRCNGNATLSISGDWEGKGPVIDITGSSCVIEIRDAKLKADSLIDGAESSTRVTLENVTLEASDVLGVVGPNAVIDITNSTLKAAAKGLKASANLKLSLTDSTIEAARGPALLLDSNPVVQLSHATLKSNQEALQADSNLKLTAKGDSRLISTDGVAINADSNARMTFDEVTVESVGTAFKLGSNAEVTGQKLTATSQRAVFEKGGPTVQLAHSTLTSTGDTTVKGAGRFDLTDVVVSGAKDAFRSEGALHVVAGAGTRITAADGAAIFLQANSSVSLTGATLEGRYGIVGSGVTSASLQEGTVITATDGAVWLEGTNARLDVSGATLDGGEGPGVGFSFGRLTFEGGSVTGKPALLYDKDSDLRLEGTTLTGGKQPYGSGYRYAEKFYKKFGMGYASWAR